MIVNTERIFRILFAVSDISMMLIRIFFQRKVLPEHRCSTIKVNPLGLITGAIAAITAIIFGLEYIFSPRTLGFVYLVSCSYWLHWLGVILLGMGITLLGIAHHHLGRRFYSLVALKENQVFVDTGPYRYVRHTIYPPILVAIFGEAYWLRILS